MNAVQTDGSVGKYLSFKLGDETYALEITKVKEITAIVNVTGVPNVPDYFRGVINLHGSILPVIDLRLKFRMEAAEDTNQTCIIVVQHETGEFLHVVGFVVDSVSEFVDLRTAEMEPPPAFGREAGNGFIGGMGKRNGQIITLIDINKLLADVHAHTHQEMGA